MSYRKRFIVPKPKKTKEDIHLLTHEDYIFTRGGKYPTIKVTAMCGVFGMYVRVLASAPFEYIDLWNLKQGEEFTCDRCITTYGLSLLAKLAQ